MGIVLMRIFFAIFGLVLLADAVLPNKTDRVTVDRHRSAIVRDENDRHALNEVDYKLELIGGSVSSCDVGHTVFTTVKDGDLLELSSTRLMKRCTRISRQGKTLHREGVARFLFPLAGLVLIAAAFGLVQIDEENSSFFGIRF